MLITYLEKLEDSGGAALASVQSHIHTRAKFPDVLPPFLRGVFVCVPVG